jgi:hypothetical protein
MSIFPTIHENSIDNSVVTKELPFPKEYAWDFVRNDFILEKGQQKIVTGAEAVKVWIYKALKTPRYRYLAYTWDYGHELEALINLGLSKEAVYSEVERYLNECLKVNPYIKAVKDINLDINGDEFSISFVVDTLYSEVKINV